jgi:nucleoside-diphosphate-sugar epimerase
MGCPALTTLLVFGCGFSGTAIARRFGEGGAHVFGTTRSPAKFDTLRRAGVEPLEFSGTLGPDLRAALGRATHIVLSISPDQGGDPSLAALAGNLADDLATLAPNLVWGAYLSTVGVYGDHGGAWVDEMTPCRPVSSRSVARVAAERAWMDVFASIDVPLAVLRLSGIYGPGRNPLRAAMDGTARRLVKPGQVFNRIRVEDIAEATAFLAGGMHGGIFNVTDDEPAPPQDVVAHACMIAGVPLPPEQEFATAELTPMARSFYGENKRVSNAKLKALGFAFRHPDYRVSLQDLWQGGRWRSA